MSENDLIRRGDALDAISGDFNASFSAIAALPARGVGVKPLVWRDGKISAQSVRETAETPFGTYEVLRWSTGDFGGSMPGAEGYEPTEYGDMASLEAAKAAAQANYEARILAALSPAPVEAQARECAECGERDPRWQSACPLSYCPHVNETPKSEHDAGNVLTAPQAREAALREAADLFQLHPWSWNAKEIRAKILALIGEPRT